MNDRRKAIIDILSLRRHDKIDNLAFELKVSRRTIERDLILLSQEYPIYTTQGTGGGVHVMDGAQLNLENRFSTEQLELLQRLSKTLIGKDIEIMKGILLKYGNISK